MEPTPPIPTMDPPPPCEAAGQIIEVIALHTLELWCFETSFVIGNPPFDLENIWGLTIKHGNKQKNNTIWSTIFNELVDGSYMWYFKGNHVFSCYEELGY